MTIIDQLLKDLADVRAEAIVPRDQGEVDVKENVHTSHRWWW
jgi:hypothetical protein